MTIRISLSRWTADLDASGYIDAFPGSRIGRQLEPVHERFADYYLALVSELFDMIRGQGRPEPADWSALGNALADVAIRQNPQLRADVGISREDALLFGATAFSFGGFPASAYVVAQHLTRHADRPELDQACVELLMRPAIVRSGTVIRLLDALRTGDMPTIEAVRDESATATVDALSVGPDEWIPATLRQRLVERIAVRNVRAVLPDGASGIWEPLVASFLARTPPIWEYFPSQIQAIRGGLLSSPESFSLQMPTGAGKTALTETLLFHHAQTQPDSVAVLIVPFRSLASELRHSMVQRLNNMAVRTLSLYGGSVPTADESRDIDNLSALVATPETLSGLIGANDAFLRRISLVVCDEGHLLDSGDRGVALELLLARLRARETGSPKFVFVSAIVPNVEEINAWLGGNPETVIVSDYRPALAEFAVLRESGGANRSVDLVMHPEIQEPARYTVHGFLTAQNFRWVNPATGRPNTYPWNSVKVRAIAAARKAMALGSVAVFTATKGGNQGAIALAAELVDQLRLPLDLPLPMAFADETQVEQAQEYLSLEFGAEWVGTTALGAGAVLHHGDIPQETREVLEHLVRSSAVACVICTTTLAEGVNLPIRTLVLYTTRRRSPEGQMQSLLTRDIKNLVGRAGRPGASTKGLVVCANDADWPVVRRVALQIGSEPVHGALRDLLRRLRRALARQPGELSNGALEATHELHPLVDGIDATLIDLAAEEVGEEELLAIARRVASETFAFEQADEESRATLETVFELRAERVMQARTQGRMSWIRRTGARLRHLDAVVNSLLPLRPWEEVADPLDAGLFQSLFRWAWDQSDVRVSVRSAYRLDPDTNVRTVRTSFRSHIEAWLSGDRISAIADRTDRPVDDVVRIQTQAVAYAFQTVVEQGTALLEMALASLDRPMPPAVKLFSEHLRYGVPTPHARRLCLEGVRHRSAAVELGDALLRRGVDPDNPGPLGPAALAELEDQPEYWRQTLGSLVLENTRNDLTAPVGRAGSGA